MTPDEASFLKAIADSPADETARLAYADWLSDRDDPRGAFARLSADFLRCVRGLADLRRAHPPEWLEVTDPLFNRFHLIRVPDLGPGYAHAVVTDIFVTPGAPALKGAPILSFTSVSETWAQRQLRAEESGLVTAVFVRPGETVLMGQPLVAYLWGAEKYALRTPRGPMLQFIHALESQRRSLRQNPPELNNALLARHATALELVFDAGAIQEARHRAWRELGWDPQGDLEADRKQRGVADGDWVQVRIDVHIRTLRALLARYGQPDGFRESPADGA